MHRGGGTALELRSLIGTLLGIKKPDHGALTLNGF